MQSGTGNIYEQIDRTRRDEEFVTLLATSHLTIERIVSTGQETPPGEWLEQDRAEWVILLQGSAALRFADEAAPRRLAVGDYIQIPAQCRHRVEGTDAQNPTIWLAIHYDG